MNQKTATGLFVILIFLVVIFMGWVVNYMIKNKEAFVENPLIYGAEKMGNVECSCIQYQNDVPIHFAFNDTNLWQRKMDGGFVDIGK